MVTKVLPYGAQVVATSIDMYGFLGREKHPSPTDVGFLGIVTANRCETYHCGSLVDIQENVLGGTDLISPDPLDEEFDHVVVYTVRSASGRELELLDFELEPVGLPGWTEQ